MSAAQRWEFFELATDQAIIGEGAMRVGGTMIDALLNVATFALLVLCIVGFRLHRHRL
jgi:hypothetical protein